jgi:hypothetical protein
VSIFIVAVLLFQPVKGALRQFERLSSSDLSTVERAALILDFGYNYYFSGENAELTEQLNSGSIAIATRASHLETTAGILRDTPAVSGFRLGETYIPILTKFIPRAIWDDKPKENLGNTWARDYSYLGVDDYTTSYNLPWLPEMYMNFGLIGVILISLMIGIIYRWLHESFWAQTQDPVVFAMGLCLAAPLMMVESNLSMTLGSIISTAIALFIFIRILLGCFSKHFVLKSH